MTSVEALKFWQVNELSAYQASRRGGELGLELSGDRVFMVGQEIIVIEGMMKV